MNTDTAVDRSAPMWRAGDGRSATYRQPWRHRPAV